MNQEEEPTAKVVAEARQISNVRKITIESMQPLIQKLEEHIGFLLQETKLLRIGSTAMMETTSNHIRLQTQIDKLSTSINNTNTNITIMEGKREQKSHSTSMDIKQLQSEVQLLKQEMKLKSALIEDIVMPSSQQQKSDGQSKIKHMDENKAFIASHINQMKTRLDKYYEKQIGQIQAIKKQSEDLNGKVETLRAARDLDRKEIDKIGKIAVIYQGEKKQIRELIDKAFELAFSSVPKQQYNQDRSYQKIENELLQASIKKILDEALTPQIRKFLPNMIAKLQQLRKIQSRTFQLQSSIASHRQNISKLQVDLVHHHTSIQNDLSNIKSNTDDKQQILKEEIQKLMNQRFNENRQSMQVLQGNIERKLNDLNSQFKMDLEKKFQSLQIFMNYKYLNQHAADLYSIVQKERPTEDIEEYNKIRQIVCHVHPLVDQVKADLKASSEEIRKSTQVLNEKLTSFGNQITKLKSNIGIQFTQNKKTLEAFSSKQALTNKALEQLSKVVAVTFQAHLISISLQINEKQVYKQSETYVTFNDGYIYQIQQGTLESQIIYRHKTVNREYLRKSLLKEMVAEIDFIVTHYEKLLGWENKQSRPSHFFSQKVLSSYLKVEQEEKKARRGMNQSEGFKQASLKLRPKLKLDNLSKTIDEEVPFSSRYLNEPEGEDKIRKNLRLKKL